MKKKMLKRMICLGITLVLAFITLTGCGEKDTDSQASEEQTTVSTEESTTEEVSTETEEPVEVTTLICGTSGSYTPYCYIDSQTNEFTGYDVELLKAAVDLLPQYEIEFKAYDATERMLALESDKIDIAAGQFEKNAEREEKYLFSTVGYTNASSQVIVKGDNTEINGVEDLEGKKCYVISNSNASYQMESYIAETGADIELVYGENNFEVIASMLDNGSIDAYINTARTVALNNAAYGTDHKPVGGPIMESSTYYLFNKNNTKLQEDIDGALKELKESGKMAEICTEWLGADFTPAE